MARKKDGLAVFRLLFAILLLTASLGARELPIRSFTTADGLADNRVVRIVSDSRGLLWICTGGGISRFDGAHFQSFGVAQGLPFPAINDLIETPEGDFWLASNGGGVIRFSLSSATRRYEASPVSSEPTSNRVNRLMRGPDGAIWVGTDGGLFRMAAGVNGTPAFTRVGLRRRGHPDEMVQVWAIVRDPEGSLWVGTRFGLVRILPGGRIVSYAIRRNSETDNVFSLLYTPEDGLLWIGHQSGLAIFKPPAASSYGRHEKASLPLEDESISRAITRKFDGILSGNPPLPRALGEAVHFDTSQSIQAGAFPSVPCIARSQSGGIHIIFGGTVLEYSTGRFSQLRDHRFQDLFGVVADDDEGNLWLGVQAGGLLRLARRGFVTFGQADGLGRAVAAVFESRGGELIAVSQDWRVSRFDGQSFHTVRANIPTVARRTGWRGNLGALQDRAGDWWFATAAGLVRFSGIRRIEDLATSVPHVYTSRDGLAQDSITRLFEDSRGDIWSAGLIPGHVVLTRWDRTSGRFQTYSDADGLQPFNAPTSFYDDPRGVLWITFRDGGIARYEAGRFRMLTQADGLPPGGIGTTVADHSGRLWCTNGRLGLYRIDDFTAAQLRPVVVATPKELGASVGRMVEDTFGSIYAFTSQGVVHIENASTVNGTATARIAEIYTANDGLAGGEGLSTYADRRGRLWFSTTQGLSYYQPREREEPSALQVRIGGLRIAGVEQPISPAGEVSLSGLELIPGRSQLEIDFFGISFAMGQALSYEYRLVGASDNWSAPSRLRSVVFANLAPGRYEFEVRAVSTGGARSPQPARATFRVLPPIYLRWWFLTLAALVLATGVVAFERYHAAHRREIHRAREQRLAELEQVRQQIAADLHDEVGSSLTQISILSEVARRQGAETVPELSHPLSTIAASSRELVDAMSDIVWAINPAKDHLSDLTQRMRRLAGDAFASCDATPRLELPPRDAEVKLAASLRRELFLIYKEAINNMVKHSGCSEAVIRLAIQDGVLRLELRDNGKGFDPSLPADGHGLISLRRRASALGGTLAVVSAPGAGTAITLDLRLST